MAAIGRAKITDRREVLIALEVEQSLEALLEKHAPKRKRSKSAKPAKK